MSNEKLGAEQGREFDFEAIGDAIDRVLAGQRELTPAEQKNLRGIYSKLFTKLKPEQAYHARGAAQLRHWTCRECSYQFAGGGNGVTYCPSCCKATLTEYVPSEPGADTGTTPPEGLSEAVKRVKARIRAVGREIFCPREQWQKELETALDEELTALAATQRAPVEQGRDRRTFEEVIQLHIDSSESMLGVFQRTGDAPGAGMQRGVTAGLKRAIEVYGNWSARQAAPDHAREGALE